MLFLPGSISNNIIVITVWSKYQKREVFNYPDNPFMRFKVAMVMLTSFLAILLFFIVKTEHRIWAFINSSKKDGVDERV